MMDGYFVSDVKFSVDLKLISVRLGGIIEELT